ncbi:hypothetical protein BDW62DRAFT_68799 [Aspergillus aurantiobrunneus]
MVLGPPHDMLFGFAGYRGQCSPYNERERPYQGLNATSADPQVCPISTGGGSSHDTAKSNGVCYPLTTLFRRERSTGRDTPVFNLGSDSGQRLRGIRTGCSVLNRSVACACVVMGLGYIFIQDRPCSKFNIPTDTVLATVWPVSSWTLGVIHDRPLGRVAETTWCMLSTSLDRPSLAVEDSKCMLIRRAWLRSLPCIARGFALPKTIIEVGRLAELKFPGCGVSSLFWPGHRQPGRDRPPVNAQVHRLRSKGVLFPLSFGEESIQHANSVEAGWSWAESGGQFPNGRPFIAISPRSFDGVACGLR